YCAWLGWHWLPLDYSDGEFVGFVSRLWDVRRALLQQHALPWWTPYYLSGSSYGLHHSQGLYLVPSLLFSVFFDLLTSVKLTALLGRRAVVRARRRRQRLGPQQDGAG